MTSKGLFGFFSSIPTLVPDAVAFISSRLNAEEEFIHRISADGRCLIGVITSKLIPYPAVLSGNNDGARIGACDGIFFSESRLRAQPHLVSDASLSLPSEANGMFAVAGYSGAELHLLSDPFGTLPLYYFLSKNILLFSSSLRLLAENPFLPRPAFSETGAAQLLCYGTVYDGATVFEGIRRLRNAEALAIDTASMTTRTRRYWTPEVYPTDADRSLKRTVESFEQAVTRAVAVAPTPLSASLSGGFDSRTIWAVLHHLRCDARAVTHGIQRGHDVEIAIRVARILNIEHDIHWIDGSFRADIRTHLDELVETTNGLISADNTHLSFVYRKHLGRGHTIFDGNHSHIEGRWALRNTARRVMDRHGFVEAFRKQLYRPDLLALVTEDNRQRVIEIARAALDAILPDPREWPSAGCAADAANVNHLLAFHGTDAVCLQNHYNRYISPYFDLDYVNELSKVPEALRWKQVPQYEIVRRFAPQLAGIPRCYADVKTFATSNPYLLRLPVAWHRKVLPMLQRLLPHTFTALLDPFKPSMDYTANIQAFRQTMRDGDLVAPSFLTLFNTPEAGMAHLDKDANMFFRTLHLKYGCSLYNKS